MTQTLTNRSDSGGRSSNDQQLTELSELRQSLSRKYEYIREDNPELYREIDAWIRESVDLPDGSVGSAVKSRLRELNKNNKMRDHRGVDDGEKAFPEDCEQCPHYGVACPMVKRYSVTRTLETILETAETDDQVIEQVTDLAIDNDCHVVLEVLDDYQQSTAEFLKAGYRLNSRALDTLSGPAEGDEPGAVTTEYSEGPSPEAEAVMNETVAAVMGDDEEDDSE